MFFGVHVCAKIFDIGKEKVPSPALFSWPISLESLGSAPCCCLQSIVFSAKYERCMSSYRRWDGHSFSPWPALNGFVLKLCSLFVLLFPPIFGKDQRLSCPQHFEQLPQKNSEGHNSTCKTSACMHACAQSVHFTRTWVRLSVVAVRPSPSHQTGPRHRALLTSGGTGLIHPGVPSI